MEEWIFEYEELMFGPKHDIDSMEKAAEIKFQHMPKKVYKYRYFCDEHKNALEKGVLYSSGPDKLNDFKEANLVLSDTGRRRFAQKAYDDLRIRDGLPEASVSSCMDILTIIECYYRNLASGLYLSEPVKMPDILLHNLKESLNQAMEKALDNYRREMRDTYQICSFSATNKMNSCGLIMLKDIGDSALNMTSSHEE